MRWRCCDEPRRVLFDCEVRQKALEAEKGRKWGRVELKEGVDNIEEERCDCAGGSGLGGGDGELGRDIVLLDVAQQ